MQTPAARTLALRTNTALYPGSAEHISAVRADLRPLLRDYPMADEVILCASELAANAALHSRSRLPGGTFTIDSPHASPAHIYVHTSEQRIKHSEIRPGGTLTLNLQQTP